MDVATRECEELMGRTWSSSSGSDSDGPMIQGIRKRRSPSAESDHSDTSELSDVSEPGDEVDGVLKGQFHLNEKGMASPASVDLTEMQQLIVEDFGELPVIDDDILGCLPDLPVDTAGSLIAPQPVVAIPVQGNGLSAATASQCDSDSSDDTAAPIKHQKLDKRQRNRMAAAKCRRNKRLRETKVREELEQLQKKVCTLQDEKKQMQSQLEQFRKYFSQQNLSSALLSGLCVICAVICVVAPHGMSSSAASPPGNHHFSSPTARSLLSVATPPQDVADPPGLQPVGEMSATELLLSCLSAAHHTAFQEIA
eukprot:COSAG02_NODE_157_length_32999_cov_31.863647_19_plen_310_part_00